MKNLYLTRIFSEWLVLEYDNPKRNDGNYKRFICVTEECDHKTFEGSQKGLGQSLTILLYEEDSTLKCANFPLSIKPVGSNETTAKDNAALIQAAMKENKMESIAKELCS